MFFKIFSGLGGGFGGATYSRTEEYVSSVEAEAEAREEAIAEYQSYEGCHGIVSWQDIEDNLIDFGLGEDATDNEIEEVYNQEVESWIEYWVEETDNLEDDSEFS